MRTSILLWSTFSGLLLGVFAGVVLAAGAYGLSLLLPARWDGALDRLRGPLLVVCFVLLPLGGAVVGFLEGRLKLS